MKTRWVLDLAMTLLIIVAMSYRITGDVAHQLIGVAAVVLFIAHNIINWKWYRSVLKGKYDLFRFTRTFVNLLTIVLVIVLVINAIFLSRALFPFIDAGESMLPKRMHTFAAYWLFILISLHIGLHWGLLLDAINVRGGVVATMALRFMAFVIVLYGVCVSMSRDVCSRLIMYYSFDFWDPSRPAVGFIISNMAIMGLYIVIGYYSLKFLRKCGNFRTIVARYGAEEMR